MPWPWQARTLHSGWRKRQAGPLRQTPGIFLCGWRRQRMVHLGCRYQAPPECRGRDCNGRPVSSLFLRHSPCKKRKQCLGRPLPRASCADFGRGLSLCASLRSRRFTATASWSHSQMRRVNARGLEARRRGGARSMATNNKASCSLQESRSALAAGTPSQVISKSEISLALLLCLIAMRSGAARLLGQKLLYVINVCVIMMCEVLRGQMSRGQRGTND